MMVMTVMVMVTVIPMVAVMMMPPMVAVMTVMVIPMVAVMRMPPLHVGRQLADIILPDRDARRADRSHRLRLLHGSRNNQKRAESGKS